MVKGAAPASSSSTTAPGATAPRQQLPTMQTGQLPSDPLTQLNGHRGFGAMAGINPFAEMGLNPNDPNMMQGMLNNPAFLQQMSAMMSNPEVIEQIIRNSPELAGNPEHARQMLNSPIMRGILSNPEQLQQLLQMSTAMRGAGGPGFGFPSAAAAPSFPAPGVPGQPASTTTPPSTTAPNTTPAPNPGFNPFLFGLGGVGAAGGAAAGAGGANPWQMPDPALMQQFFGNMGGAAPAQPADTRSPEERFQVQLGQLNEMGFWDAQQNIRALLATGGNVHAAIEYMLSGAGGGGA
ncbi:hypothetical protein H0H87_006350 [Tephrocybe sp. NHM501043]|nr:hypothetical protein H0H87_006350 [Tephrocybe sp. NHM501043]